MIWKLLVAFSTSLLIVFIISNKNSIQTHSELKQDRFPSSQSQINQDLEQILSPITKLQSVAEVDAVLQTIKAQISDKKAAKLSVIDRLSLESIEIIQMHKGFIFRLLPLIETNDVTSVMSTSFLKSIKQNISSQTPWLHHLFDYLFLEVKDSSRFRSISDVQNHFLQKLVPRATNLIAVMDEMEGRKLHLDLSEIAPEKFNHLPASVKQFSLDESHFLMAKESILSILAWGHYLSSYNLNDTPEILEKLVKTTSRKTLLTQLGRQHPIEKSNLLSSADMFRLLSLSKYNSFLTLKPEAISLGTLAKSRSYLMQALQTQQKLHKNLNHKSTSFKDLNFLQNEIKLLSSNDAQTVIHPMNGELISVNPSRIWSNHQNDLKKYIPTAFYSQKTQLVGQNKMIDLNFGKAVAWRDASFGGVLINANDNNLRNLTEGLLLNPTSSFVGMWLKSFQ
jgi:hypothetical protein